MTKTSPGWIRRIFYTFAGIAFVILLTGGGRVGKVDFISLDAWVAVALLFALVLHRRGNAILGPGLMTWCKRVARRPFWIAGIIFTVLGITHVTRFLTLGVNLFDAGFVYQALFHTLGPPFLKCDVCHLGSFIGAHTAFTLAILGPVATLFGTPFIIPVLQAGLGFGIFLILGRSYRSELRAEELTFVFILLLCVRGIREGFLFDFREDLLAALFYMAGLALVRARRYAWALIPLILAAFSKESGAILLPFTALTVVLLEREQNPDKKFNSRLATVYFGLSLVISGLIVFYILPSWTPNAGAGGDLAGRLHFLRDQRLGKIFSDLMTAERLKYVIYTLIPVSLIAFRKMNPYYLPGFILVIGNLLSSAPTQRMMQFHYELILIPFFAFGMAESLVRLKAAEKIPRSFYILTLLSFLALSGTWPLSHLRQTLKMGSPVTEAFWARERIKSVPERSPVLGDERTLPLITDHREIRFLGDLPFNPATKSAMSPLLIGDSRFALMQKALAEKNLGSQWKLRGCSPAEMLCWYERK